MDNGEILINCLAYIDLNPCRTGIVKKPEEYRWCSLGYHALTENRDGFLSTDFGLREFAVKGERERLAHYRRFVYEKGGLLLEPADLNQGLELSNVDRFRYRTRYFTDSGIIGTKDFVSQVYPSRLPKNLQEWFREKRWRRVKMSGKNCTKNCDALKSTKRMT